VRAVKLLGVFTADIMCVHQHVWLRTRLGEETWAKIIHED